MPGIACKQIITSPEILTISWKFSTSKHLSVTGSQIDHHSYLFVYLSSSIGATQLINQSHSALRVSSANVCWKYCIYISTGLQQMLSKPKAYPASDRNIRKQNHNRFSIDQNLRRILHSTLVSA